MLLSRGRWPCHYSLHISWPLEIPALHFSHTCSIHLSGTQVSIHACVRGEVQPPQHVHARKYVCRVAQWRRQSALAWQPASQGKKIYSQTEIQMESRRGKTPSHTASLLGFFFFFPWEGLSLPTCVKVCFVFAAGLRHKASGSCLVKCWWRYYKVKSRVYKPAVCMVRAFPAEQWVSKLVW